jgi:predicted  nucleic acid-binding Zn-ribbon protein
MSRIRKKKRLTIVELEERTINLSSLISANYRIAFDQVAAVKARLDALELQHDRLGADFKGHEEDVLEASRKTRATVVAMEHFLSTDRLRDLESLDRRLAQLERKVPDHVNRNIFDPQAKLRELQDDVARARGETRQRCKDTEARLELALERIEALNRRVLELEGKQAARPRRAGGAR